MNATWKGGRINAPIGGLGVTQGPDAPFMVRWTGVLSLPAGTWQLGGLTNGAMRVYLNGSSTAIYDDWAGTASATSPSYGSATVSGSGTYQIDDRHPAALQYTYSGTPALLRSVTDPVSGRAINLSYGPDAACPTTNPAPAGMLCEVSYWNGTTTTFGYNGNGQIASVTDPGSQTTLLAYDSDNRLADIRDALANAVVAGGGQAGTPVGCPAGTTGLSVSPVDTQICYDSTGRVSTVTQPAPTTGAARPARTYATDHTDVASGGCGLGRGSGAGISAAVICSAAAGMPRLPPVIVVARSRLWSADTRPGSYPLGSAGVPAGDAARMLCW